MNNNETILLDTDRIVEINGFKLFVNDDYRSNRRNVICYSNTLQIYITLNRLTNKNTNHTIKIGDFINNNILNDIKVVELNGYY
jgi:hypothetical protein